MKIANSRFHPATRAALVVLIQDVQTVFDQHGITVPFFIAGGSIFSTIQVTDPSQTETVEPFRDVDVFFRTGEDFRSAVDAINTPAFKTKNAVTHERILRGKKDLQLIRARIGEPREILDSFDLSCSQIGVTSELDLFSSVQWSRDIRINPGTMAADTPKRYWKYRWHKKARDPGDATLLEMYRFFIEHSSEKFMDYYNQHEVTGAQVLTDCLRHNRLQEKHHQHIHDTIVALKKPFQRIKPLGMIMKNINFSIENGCLEYALCKFFEHKRSFESAGITGTQKEQILDKYPEFLI